MLKHAVAGCAERQMFIPVDCPLGCSTLPRSTYTTSKVSMFHRSFWERVEDALKVQVKWIVQASPETLFNFGSLHSILQQQAPLGVRGIGLGAGVRDGLEFKGSLGLAGIGIKGFCGSSKGAKEYERLLAPS